MSLATHLNTLTKAWEVLFHEVPLSFEVASEAPPPFVLPGDVVALADGRAGLVDSVDLSPYWPEEQAGVQRAYIVGEGWTDWVLENQVVAVLA